MSPDRASGIAVVAVRMLFSIGLAGLLLGVGVPALREGGANTRAAASFFASPLLLYALLHVVGLGLAARARGLRKVGGIVLLERGTLTHVRFAYAQPIVLGVYATWLSAVVLAIVGAAALPLAPWKPGLVALWVTILAPIVLGTAVFVLTWRWVRSGETDLVIDPDARVLRMPRGRGRDAETLSFGDIHGIEVGPKVDPSAPGADLRMDRHGLAAVVFVDRWKSPARARRLGAWSDRKPAEEFAAWLRDRVSLSPGAPAPDQA